MQYFIIQNFTSEKGNIFGERWRPKDERKLLNGSMQQQVYVHVILYGILQDNKNLKLFLDTLKDSLSTEISDPNIRYVNCVHSLKYYNYYTITYSWVFQELYKSYKIQNVVNSMAPS